MLFYIIFTLFRERIFIMRKKITCFVLILSMLLPFVFTTNVQASNNTELNIYALYLNSSEKGDSVLLESKGNYLLIDLGTSDQVPTIINQLSTLNVTHVNIMFSHLHKDHIGGSSSDMLSGLKQLQEANINVDTLYLANPSLSPLSLNNQKRYARLEEYFNSLPNSRIQYLTVGDRISVGDAEGKVIGPVNTNSLSPENYAISPGSTLTSTGSSIYTYYENNCSLALIFTCGSTKYFTAGDCMLDEANALLSYYGSTLKCDIMKLSHHGVSAGNSTALLQVIQPSYSFASNTKFTDLNEETDHWHTYGSSKRATHYGPCYLIGNEKKTIIYNIKNDHITLYKGKSITPSNQVKGWLFLYGEDGFYRDHNMYYFSANGNRLTGVQKIGKHYYFFDNTGRMEYGKYSSSGDYSGWLTYENGRRHFQYSYDEKYAYMSKGFDTIGGNKYYFTKDGYLLTNDTEDPIFKILGSGYYAIMPDNTIATNEFIDFTDGYTYFFGNTGNMAIDQKKYIDGDYYIFDEDGHLVHSGSDDYYLKYQYNGRSYFIYSDGSLAVNELISYNENKYYVNEKGNLITNKVVFTNGHHYYFGKSGKMITDKKIIWKGKKYYCKPNGILKRIKPAKTKKKDD